MNLPSADLLFAEFNSVNPTGLDQDLEYFEEADPEEYYSEEPYFQYPYLAEVEPSAADFEYFQSQDLE